MCTILRRGADIGYRIWVSELMRYVSWALNQTLREDFAYNANHALTVAAKEIIFAHYDQTLKCSYFTGCSDGGHEALMESQRYPDD